MNTEIRYGDPAHRKTFDYFLMTNPTDYIRAEGFKSMTFRFKKRNSRKRFRFSDYDVLRVTSRTIKVRPKSWRKFAK